MASGCRGFSSQPLQPRICLPRRTPTPRLHSSFLQCSSPADPVAMVKEKGNYKYRSLCMVVEVGAAGLGYLTGDDQWKARQTCSWCKNPCIVKPCFAWTETSLRTFNLATASERHPISGVFAQLSCWLCACLNRYCIWNFWLCLRLASCLHPSLQSLPHLAPPKSMTSLG